MTERIRQIFDTTLSDEPPLVDIVTGAVEGAQLKRRRQRRDRIAVAVSPLVLVALVVGAHSVLPDSASTGSDKAHPAASAPSTSAIFPPVAADKPVNATPAVHQAVAHMCNRDWSKSLAPISTNMMPNTQQEAVDMCVLTGEALMTLMPEATVTLADTPNLSMSAGPGQQWVVKTAAGHTQIGIDYLWPDSTYEKKHYGPFNVCRPNPVNDPPVTTVPGPDGKPFPMKDQSAGHTQYCVQTHPADQFYGSLTMDYTDNTLFYSVVDNDYGRYLISTSTVSMEVPTKPATGPYSGQDGKYFVQDDKTPPAMTLAKFGDVLLDPRFNDYLVHYEHYVLTHATAASFGVSGSKPLK